MIAFTYYNKLNDEWVERDQEWIVNININGRYNFYFQSAFLKEYYLTGNECIDIFTGFDLLYMCRPYGFKACEPNKWKLILADS